MSDDLPNFWPPPQPQYTFTPSVYVFPPRFSVPNKRVAVEPFPPAPKAEVKGGVIAPMNQASLTGLRVVFGSPNLPVGNLVYVRSKLQATTTYAKEIFEVEGQRFILIPEDDVLLVDTTPPAPAAP